MHSRSLIKAQPNAQLAGKLKDALPVPTTFAYTGVKRFHDGGIKFGTQCS
jgi:hypothetical protein